MPRAEIHPLPAPEAPMTPPAARQGNITVSFETITPDLARAMLKTNTHNRKTRPVAIGAMARDMQNGQWLVNGDTIRFYDGNVLADGQHRLIACIEADTPFTTLVVRGLPEEAGRTIDQGLKRTAADVLALAGFPPGYTWLLAAMSRAVLAFCVQRPRIYPSVGELEQVAIRYKQEFLMSARAIQRVPKVTPGATASLSGAIYAICLILPEHSHKAADILAAMTGDAQALARHPTLHTLRERLISRELSGIRRTRDREYQGLYAAMIREYHQEHSKLSLGFAADMTIPGLSLERLGLTELSDLDSRDRIARLARGED